MCFHSFQDVQSFVIGISGAVRQSNKNFAGVTNKSIVTHLMMQTKLKFMAKQRKTKVSGLLTRAIYLTIGQTWPEDTFYEIKTKY